MILRKMPSQTLEGPLALAMGMVTPRYCCSLNIAFSSMRFSVRALARLAWDFIFEDISTRPHRTACHARLLFSDAFRFCRMLPLGIDGFADGDPLRVLRQSLIVVPLLVLLALFWQVAKESVVVCYRYVLFALLTLPPLPSSNTTKCRRRQAESPQCSLIVAMKCNRRDDFYNRLLFGMLTNGGMQA